MFRNAWSHLFINGILRGWVRIVRWIYVGLLLRVGIVEVKRGGLMLLLLVVVVVVVAVIERLIILIEWL